MKPKPHNLCLLLLLFLIGCNTDLEDPHDDLKDIVESSETIVNTISLTGEFSSLSQAQSSSISENTIYGIQVYFRPISKDSKYQPYAYGLFNDQKAIKIQLLEDFEYQVIASAILNGTNLIAHNEEDNAYWNPFITTSATQLTNTFNYSTQHEMRGLSQSQTMMKDEDGNNQLYNCPTVDRYYGKTNAHIPTAQNIDINMERVSFEANFVLDAANAHSLTVLVKGAPMLQTETKKDSYYHIHGIFTIPEDLNRTYIKNARNNNLMLSTTFLWKDKTNKINKVKCKNITYKKRDQNIVDIY